MSDDVFPLKPAHPLASGSEISESQSLLLYRGEMTGRWFDVAVTVTTRSASSGGDTQTKVVHAELDASGVGEVALKLSPDPHLEWLFWHHGVSLDDVPVPLGEWPEMVPPQVASAAFATRAGPDGPPKPPGAGLVSGGRRREMRAIEIGDRSGRVDEIRFYLVNFQVWFLTEHVKRNEETDKLAGMRLCSNEWRVEIERRADFSDVQGRIEEQRGYGITHHCRLWRARADGSPESFDFDDAAPVLEAVTLFASFVRGGMVGLALPVGYSKDQSSFESWGVSAADAGRYPDPYRQWPLPGWYPLYRPPGYESPHPATWLPSLFEALAGRCLHSDADSRRFWQGVLRELVYTYADAERLDKERAVVPACTALETLGWAVLVVQERWLTGDRHPDRGRGGYERLTAADRLRLLLRWAGLAPTVPANLPKLQAKAAENNGRMDSADLITWARNRVVHPDKHDQLPDGLASEAWLVAMYYAELIMLKLLGYDGYYRNRLNNEEVERVPWSV